MGLSTKKQAAVNSSRHMPVNLSKSALILTITSVFLAIFFLIMPFQNGIFNDDTPANEVRIFWSFIIGGALAVCLAFYIGTVKKTVSLLPQLIWLMPLFYLLSSIGAVSSYHAYRQLSIWIFYAILFILAYYYTQTEKGQKTAIYIVMGAASLIIFCGMSTWLGSPSLGGILPESWYFDAIQQHEDGMRLTSIFQYANTYAVFLLAYIFACVAAMTLSKNKVILVISSAMVIPALLSFMFTLSRGAWVIAPIVFIAILPLLRISKQIQFTYNFIVSVVVFAITLPFINKWGLELQNEYSAGTAIKAWGLLIVACAIMTALSYLANQYVWNKVEQRLASKNERLRFNLILPILALVVVALGAFLLLGNSGLTKILPESIGQRIESINFNQHSVLERSAFYGDALKIWKDYPIIGAGGGAWQALYQQYQDNPYTSTLVHSFVFETLLEVGLLGIICLFVMLIGIYTLFIRSFVRKTSEQQFIPFVWLTIATTILVHSLIDFNMSYIYIGALVFFSLGAMIANVSLKTGNWHAQLLQSKWKLMLPAFIAVIGVYFMFTNFIHLSGYKQFDKTTQAVQEQSLQESIEQLDKAISRNANPRYVNMQLELYIQAYSLSGDEPWANEAQAILQRMQKKEPYYEALYFRQLELNKLMGNDIASIDFLQASITKMPWEIELYQLLATTYFRVAVADLVEGNTTAAKEHLEAILALEQKIVEKQKLLALLPEEQLSGRDFYVTPKMARAIGEAYYVFGQYELALQYLGQAYTGQFEEQEDITAALYYAAVLYKLNGDNTAVTASLYAAYPNDQTNLETQINSLINAAPLQ